MKRGRPLPERTAIEKDFIQHLKRKGHSQKTLSVYGQIVARFLKHVDNVPLNRVTEDLAQSFFAGMKATNTKRVSAAAVSQFLSFAAARLPVPVAGRGSEIPPRRATKDRREVALRQHWEVDKLTEKKEAKDDLIVKLARKVIDHYVYFQGRIQGQEENIDDIHRFAAECQELIQSNLPLFMTLSAQGRNVHPKIDERVNP